MTPTTYKDIVPKSSKEMREHFIKRGKEKIGFNDKTAKKWADVAVRLIRGERVSAKQFIELGKGV